MRIDYQVDRLEDGQLDAGISITLADMHIPTGFVTLADIVRLLIAEFGVEPRRSDWQRVLDRTDQ